MPRAVAPEDQARENIDRQLSACGWVVQDRKNTDLGAGVGVAIREFPLISGDEGDYCRSMSPSLRPRLNFRVALAQPFEVASRQ